MCRVYFEALIWLVFADCKMQMLAGMRSKVSTEKQNALFCIFIATSMHFSLINFTLLAITFVFNM